MTGSAFRIEAVFDVLIWYDPEDQRWYPDVYGRERSSVGPRIPRTAGGNSVSPRLFQGVSS